jgi:hypothetical protein
VYFDFVVDRRMPARREASRAPPTVLSATLGGDRRTFDKIKEAFQ